MILILKILLHNEYKIIKFAVSNIRVSIFNFPYNSKNRVLACFQTRPVISTDTAVEKQCSHYSMK